MKKTICSLIAVLLFYVTSFAQSVPFPGPAGVGVPAAGSFSCSSTGDRVEESFDPAGYDNSWAETVSAGCIVNEDYAAPALTGFNNQSLRISTDTAYDNAYTIFTDSQDNAVSYFRVYVDVVSHSAAVWSNIIFAFSTANTQIWSVSIYNNAGQLQLRCTLSGVGSSTSQNISANTGYRIEIKSNNTANAFECLLDGNSFYTSTSSPAGDVGKIRLGVGNDNSLSEVIFDNAGLSTSGYLGSCQ